MKSVERFYQKLVEEYGCPPSFKNICRREGIIHSKQPLEQTVFGLYVRSGSHSLIVLNSALSFQERRDWAWHELWHHFHDFKTSLHYAVREERAATLFAALCRIPKLDWNATIASVVEQYDVTPWLAKARIEYELKRLNGT